MSRGLARALAIGIVSFAVICIVATGILNLPARDAIPQTEVVVVGDPDAPRMQEVLEDLEAEVAAGGRFDRPSTGEFLVFAVVTLVLMGLWMGTGALIVSRSPTNWAGWVFLITGAPFAVANVTAAVMVHGLRTDPGSVPWVGFWATVGEFTLYPVALVPLLFLLYPDGHVPSPRWRWVVLALLGGTILAFVAFLFRPGPFNAWVTNGILYENPLALDTFDVSGVAGAIIALGTIVALAASLATVVAVVQRFRRSSGELRQQMRVLVFVAALAGASLVVLLILGLVGSVFGLNDDPDSAGDWVFGLLLALTALSIVIGIPVAYLVAIFRYRLWDLDVVIRKTVVFGVLAAAFTLIAVIVVLAVPVGVLGSGLSGWEAGLLGLGVAIGLLIGPVRHRARRLADRIVYGRRATPYEVLTAFSERVGETYAVQDVLPRMAGVLASGTGATSARVLLRVGADVHEVARWPADAETSDDEHVVPVVDQGEELGALALSMPANDPMNPSKDRLVRDLASQAGLVLRNVRLIEELRASRQRLVAAQDQERRRIERDIHDGAQQRLVALAVKLRLADTLVGKDDGQAHAMLAQLQEETTDALEDLRALARGIYPPLLADKGLPTALEAQARKASVPTSVAADRVGRYPQEIESAVYFCTLEALNNVAKYANAAAAEVRLSQEDGVLSFRVHDDGRGFDAGAARSGTGLQGMADRIDAVGGDLRVESAPGMGTTVTGRIPVGGAP